MTEEEKLKLGIKNTENLVVKAISWTFFSSIVGMLYVFLLFFISTVFENLNFTLKEIINEGFYLFFSIGILASVLIDYSLSQKVIKPNLIINTLLGIIITMILVVSSILIGYLLFYNKQGDNAILGLNAENIYMYQVGISITSIFLSFIIKYYLYINEEKLYTILK